MKPDDAIRDLHGLAELHDGRDEVKHGTTCMEAADLIKAMRADLMDYPHSQKIIKGQANQNSLLRRQIDRLQAELSQKTQQLASYHQVKIACNDAGFNDFEALLAGYQQVKSELADAIESCDISDAANTALDGALAESQRRERAAVELLVKAGFCSQEPLYECDEERPAACHACITKWCLNGPQEGGIHEA